MSYILHPLHLKPTSYLLSLLNMRCTSFSSPAVNSEAAITISLAYYTSRRKSTQLCRAWVSGCCAPHLIHLPIARGIIFIGFTIQISSLSLPMTLSRERRKLEVPLLKSPAGGLYRLGALMRFSHILFPSEPQPGNLRCPGPFVDQRPLHPPTLPTTTVLYVWFCLVFFVPGGEVRFRVSAMDVSVHAEN